jgi:hypothetical protein
MRHLAAALAMSLARSHRDDDLRRADEWRALHRRPDALPDPIEPVRQSRRHQVSGFAIRLRRSVADGA